MTNQTKTTKLGAVALGFLAGLNGSTALADIVHLDDVIVSFSLCAGNDCVNGESFGFDTIRLKENNLRLHFDDTSTSASFPRNDWRFVANDSSNGGGSYMAIEDSTAGRQVFRVDAGAPANSLRVDSQGDVGIGSSNPVVELHVVDGDSPTLRLEQDGSSGFTPQTFDLAANEANFFVRDVTNGSKLPFRIKPAAPTDSLFVAADGDIGLGTASPAHQLHLRRTSGNVLSQFESTNGSPVQLRLVTTDATNRRIVGLDVEGDPASQVQLGEDEVIFLGTTNNELGKVDSTGFVVGAVTLNVPDYVFEDSYQLLPLNDVRTFIAANGHLPDVPSAAVIANDGLNMTQMQMVLLRKVEELTLYTLEQDARALEQDARIEKLTARLTAE